jgi:hypothetical protein
VGLPGASRRLFKFVADELGERRSIDEKKAVHGIFRCKLWVSKRVFYHFPTKTEPEPIPKRPQAGFY